MRAGKRPKYGPGSRTKVEEDTTNPLDATIYELFTVDALRLSKRDFNAWCRTHRIHKLSDPERKRLRVIRRMQLARVYAERHRQKKIQEEAETRTLIRKLARQNQLLIERQKRLTESTELLEARITELLE